MQSGILGLLWWAVMALCLHTATAADTISISVVPSSADPTVAVFTVNCPADGFNNEFVIYYGTTPGGVPASGVTQQAASAPLPCAGVTTVSFTYLQPGLFQVLVQVYYFEFVPARTGGTATPLASTDPENLASATTTFTNLVTNPSTGLTFHPNTASTSIDSCTPSTLCETNPNVQSIVGQGVVIFNPNGLLGNGSFSTGADCTGSIIRAQDGTDYLLTAFHCISTYLNSTVPPSASGGNNFNDFPTTAFSNTAGWNIVFDYLAPCMGAAPPVKNNQLGLQGLTPVFYNFQADVLLLQIGLCRIPPSYNAIALNIHFVEQGVGVPGGDWLIALGTYGGGFATQQDCTNACANACTSCTDQFDFFGRNLGAICVPELGCTPPSYCNCRSDSGNIPDVYSVGYPNGSYSHYWESRQAMGGIVTTKFEKTSFTPETGCQSGPCSVTYVTGTDHVQVVTTQGTVLPGASGAPLFNAANNAILGVLTGGATEGCTKSPDPSNAIYYGRLDAVQYGQGSGTGAKTNALTPISAYLGPSGLSNIVGVQPSGQLYTSAKSNCSPLGLVYTQPSGVVYLTNPQTTPPGVTSINVYPKSPVGAGTTQTSTISAMVAGMSPISMGTMIKITPSTIVFGPNTTSPQVVTISYTGGPLPQPLQIQTQITTVTGPSPGGPPVTQKGPQLVFSPEPVDILDTPSVTIPGLTFTYMGDGDTTKSAIFTHTAPDNIVSETVLLSVGLNNTQATVMVYQNGYPISILAYPPFADNPGVVSPGILTFPGGSVVKVVVTDASDLTVPLLLNSVSSLSFLGNTTHTAPVIGLDKASAAWKKAHLAATG